MYSHHQTGILLRPYRDYYSNMSTTTKRVTRPVKAKPVTPVAVPDPVAPVAVPDPVVSAAPVAVPELEVVQVESSKRQQTSRAIGVSISAARTRRHIDRLNLNNKLDSMISDLRASLAEFNYAKTCLDSGKVKDAVQSEVEKDGKKVKVVTYVDRVATEAETLKFKASVAKLGASVAKLELDASALGRERTRFSNDAAVVLSIVCDELIQQVTEHTMNRVLAAKKKIIQIEHLHATGIENITLYPLIKTLPTFLATSESLAATLLADTTTQNLAVALAQAERDFKKKYNVHLPKKKRDAEDPAEPAEPAAVELAVAEPDVVIDDEEDDSADSKTSFRFYVGQVCKDMIKTDPRYKSVRVSTEIRGYLSDILVELIQRLSQLILLTAGNMKNKTINGAAILRTVEALIIDGHAAVETVDISDGLVADPAVVKAEQLKKDAAKKTTPPTEYKIDFEKIPQVPGRFAVRTVKYPTSGFAALEEKVQAKLVLYRHLLSEKEAAALAAEEADDAPDAQPNA